MAEGKSQAKDKFNQSGAKQATRVKMGNTPDGKRYGTNPFSKTKGKK